MRTRTRTRTRTGSHLEVFLRPSGCPLGALSGPSWGPLEVPLGCFGVLLEIFWEILGPSWGPFGALLGALEGFVRPSWRPSIKGGWGPI
eukprot:5196805-Pyramimonas_sp.AAC.1